MPQINATLSEPVIEEIMQLANMKRQSFSKTVSDLIEIGLKNDGVADEKNIVTKNASHQAKAVMEKEAEYLLRIVNLCSEIYRFTFNEKTHFDSHDPERAMKQINEKIKERLYGDDHPND